MPPDSLQAGRLLSIYGQVLGQEMGDTAGSQDASDRALAIAEREGDAALEIRTLVAAADVDLYMANWESCLTNGERAVELVSRVDDPRAESLAYFHVALSHLFLGNPDLAEGPAMASVSAAERLRHHFYQARALFIPAMLNHARGDWPAARELTERALAVSPREPRTLYMRILEEYEAGNFGEGEAVLERLLEVTRLTDPGPTMEYGVTALATPWIALISGDDTHLHISDDAVKTILSAPSASSLIAGLAMIARALLAIYRRDAAEAEKLYAEFKPLGLGDWLGFGDRRMLGLLAGTLGRFDDAMTHFEDEMAFCRRNGTRTQLAWTCSDYAEMLLDRTSAGSAQAQEGDREKAIELQDEALAITQELGMRPLTERILARREILRA
ncbi:MAG: hypothetical protein IIC92_03185 [Chloroflexi bacterium]|nr:hypothetical protein [Chloroflexota bacterium]